MPAADPGVTAKEIKLGYISPETGAAASISKNGIKGFEARIKAQNAAGGCNGRTITYVTADDASGGGNLTAAKDLVENQDVFAIVNQSPFAFLTFRYLLENGVPMVGAGSDGTYYMQKGNENILSSGGNSLVFGDVIYDTAAKAMKQAGAKKVAALAYGAASSSVASAKAFMNYAVPGAGLDPVYTNTAIDFGAQDVVAVGARHQELGRRRGVPADGGGDEHRGGAGPAAERRRHEGVGARRPGTARTSSTRPSRRTSRRARSSSTATSRSN